MSLALVLLACARMEAGITAVYSRQSRTNDNYYTSPTTRHGELLVASDDGHLVVATRYQRGSELGRAEILKTILFWRRARSGVVRGAGHFEAICV